MLHILTLTWEKCDKLCRLKESLLPALEDIPYTWHIRDNGSKDNTCDIVSTWKGNINLIKYKDNLQNFSEGMNYLFNVADAKDDDLILLLNNDVIFADNTSIKKIISLMKKDVGVVGAKLLFTDTNKLQHAGVVFNTHGNPTHFRRYENDDNHASKNRYFQAVTGAVMLTRASDFKEAGMLDTNLKWSFDDVAYCLSVLINLKKKIVYCGETKIFHDESASLKENPVNKLYSKNNILYFLSRWRGKYSVDIGKYIVNPNYNLL